MSHQLRTIIALLAGIATVLLALNLISRRYKFWAAEVPRVREGGYIPPSPSVLTSLLMRGFCILLGFFEVGPIRILGRHRLPKDGPVIIAPFHTDAGDASIVSALLGIRPMYYLIRTTELLGWRGWLGTLTGAIAVNEESQQGRSKSFKAAVSALSSKGPDCLVIFPQGQLVPDQEIRRSDFKSGVMLIAKLAARKRKQPVWIVPVGMHYKTDPSQSTLFQRFVQGLGFKKFRNLFRQQNYGAYAIVGKPFQISPETANLSDLQKGLVLTDDADKATDTYVERLQILQKEAKKKARSHRVL